jgi:hypothetical protein
LFDTQPTVFLNDESNFFLLQRKKKEEKGKALPCIYPHSRNMASLAAPTSSSVAATLNAALATSLSHLTLLWDEIGTSPGDRDAMVTQLQQKILAEISATTAAETTLRDNYLAGFSKSCAEYTTKAAALGKAEREIAPKDAAESLMQANDRANEALHTLTTEYKKVYAVHEARVEEIARLHATLYGAGEPVPEPFDAVGAELSETRLRDLDEHVRMRANEKQKRVESRARCVHEIQELLHEMRMSWDGTPFDLSVRALSVAIEDGRPDDEVDHGLTIPALAAISDRVSQLQGEKERRVDTIKGLAQQINGLWDKLSIPEAEREAFFNQHDGLGTQEMESCEAELVRLTEMKKERLKPMIENEREKIAELFDKLHFSTAQRRAFAAFTTPESLFTEAVLDAHEAYSTKLEDQFKVQAPIMKKLEKRELYKSYGDIIKQPKPSSFPNSRIARQWQQERIKLENAFKKHLPKLDVVLLTVLEQWYDTHGTHLTYDGKEFHSLITESIENRENRNAAKRATIKKGAMQKYKSAGHGGKKISRTVMGSSKR